MISTWSDPLARAIAAIARDCPESAFGAVLGTLEAAPDSRCSDLRWEISRVETGTTVKRAIASLLDNWSLQPELTAAGIALALRAAQASKESEADVDLVWTGPVSTEVPTRRTDQVLLQLIAGAINELVIISFAVHEEDRWIAALDAAVERGVKVTFVVETVTSGKVRKDGLSAISREILSKIRVLTWDLAKRPPDAFGKVGTLHAKCAVADRKSALISSANLTEFALTLNMEMGLTVRGGRIPVQIAALVEDLEMRGHLVPVIPSFT